MQVSHFALKALKLNLVAFHSITFQLKCLDFRYNEYYKKLVPVLSHFCNGLSEISLCVDVIIYMDICLLVANRTLVEFSWSCIGDPYVIFSISTLVRVLMSSLSTFSGCLCEQSVCVDKKNDTVAGRYEFHFLMFITIFYSLALLISKNNMLLPTRK